MLSDTQTKRENASVILPLTHGVPHTYYEVGYPTVRSEYTAPRPDTIPDLILYSLHRLRCAEISIAWASQTIDSLDPGSKDNIDDYTPMEAMEYLESLLDLIRIFQTQLLLLKDNTDSDTRQEYIFVPQSVINAIPVFNDKIRKFRSMFFNPREMKTMYKTDLEGLKEIALRAYQIRSDAWMPAGSAQYRESRPNWENTRWYKPYDVFRYLE